MNNSIEIVLTDEDGNITATLNGCLDAIKNGGAPAALPALEYAGYKWNTGAENEMAETVYPGQLNLLILQFEEALKRLNKNVPAILHFGEYGGEGGSYILINPVGDEADISVFFINECPPDGALPIEGVIGNPDDLYRYVNEKLRLPQEEDNSMYFKHIKIPLNQLKKAFDGEINAGRELFKITGSGLTSRLIT